MFDESLIFGVMTDNISELQVLNSKMYTKISQAIDRNEDTEKLLANLKLQLEMQENLTIICLEMEQMLADDEFDEEM